MFGDLERCSRCHHRYPAPLGHRCPRPEAVEQEPESFERGFRAWLETSEGRFAEYLAQRARRPRPVSG